MPANEIVLRVVLATAGAFIVFTGVNIGFGGIKTMGFEGAEEFIAITDLAAFKVHDSHVRFVGGLWLGVGLLFLAAAVWLKALKPVVLACTALIFIGGVARFSTPYPETLFVMPLIVPLALELVGMPLLFAWVRSVRA